MVKMVENGRKKVHRGYLVGNGFSHVFRHSPTTDRCNSIINIIDVTRVEMAIMCEESGLLVINLKN